MPNSVFIVPKKTVIVIGPKLVVQCRRQRRTPVTHKDAFLEAVRQIYDERSKLSSQIDVTKLTSVHETVYDQMPHESTDNIIRELHRMNLYESWREKVCHANEDELNVPGVLFPIATMLEKGAHLVTTAVTPLLSKCLRLQSIYLHDEDRVRAWACETTALPSILHIGGTAVDKDWLCHSNVSPAVTEILTTFFKDKSFILVGFDNLEDCSLSCFQKHFFGSDSTRCLYHLTNSYELHGVGKGPLTKYIIKAGEMLSESILKDGTELLQDLWTGHDDKEGAITFTFLIEENPGHLVQEQLQQVCNILLPREIPKRVEWSWEGVARLMIHAPIDMATSIWETLVNKDCFKLGSALFAVMINEGPVVEINGTIPPSLLCPRRKVNSAHSQILKGQPLLITNGSFQHLQPEAKLKEEKGPGGQSPSSSSQMQKSTSSRNSSSSENDRVWHSPSPPYLFGGGGVPYLVSHSPNFAASPSPVANEVKIEMVDRGAGTPQLPATVLTSPLGQQAAWAKLSCPPAPPLILMQQQQPTVGQVQGQPFKARPPIRRSTAIEEEKDTNINTDKVVGPLVGESASNTNPLNDGGIQLVHKWQEKKEKKLVHSSSSKTDLERSFDEETAASSSPQSHSPPSAPSLTTASSPGTNLSAISGNTALPHTAALKPTTIITSAPNQVIATSSPPTQGAFPPHLQVALPPLHHPGVLPSQGQGMANGMNPFFCFQSPQGPILVPCTAMGMPWSALHMKQKEGELDKKEQEEAMKSSTPDLVHQNLQEGSECLLNKRRRSTSLPDIKVAISSHFQNSNSSPGPAKKPKLETTGSNSLDSHIMGHHDREHHMLKASSFPDYNSTNKVVHNKISQKQFSEDTEMDEIIGGPVFMTPVGKRDGKQLPTFPSGRGVVQLWQFLLDLLLSPSNRQLIHWTGDQYEFRIVQPDEIARLWGKQKNKPQMNYDKLSRGLRYYYAKGIMDKVPGKKLTFRFTCDVEEYVQARGKNPNAVDLLRNLIKSSNTLVQQQQFS